MGGNSKITVVVPDMMEPETKLFMQSVLDELNAQQSITLGMVGALTILMYQYNAFMLAAREVYQDQGVTVVGDKMTLILHPAYNAMVKSSAAVYGYLKDFGLTTKSKSALRFLNSDGEDDQLALFGEQDFGD